jgi:hypothetical protein
VTSAITARAADPLALSTPSVGGGGALRWIDWIWHVRGHLPLAPAQSADEAFDRLDPLFHEAGTSVERAGDMLTFRKKDQAAQDKMSVFDGGVLRVERGAAGPVLRYHLISRALLFCFLAPFLFVAIGQFTLFTAKFQPSTEAAAKSAKASGPAKKPAAKPAPPMNPIDKMLGAPAPDKPKDGADKGSGRDKKPSATSAYVFAAMFAVLYLVGRILEDRLIRRLFRKKLAGA